ncbi:MAG: cytidylate kinase-like family protein [Deltaproteobacteria bacterium]|nr:cytidylate kinase-like family protein [Deltaproteobacteria bacterium]
MTTERQICGICAWRRDCQKRFRISTDAFLSVNCPDYTRDISIKDVPIEGIEDKKTTMDRMVEQQLKKWRSLMEEGLDVFDYGLKSEKVKGGPIITISREPGSGGSEIARKLSKDLSMDLMGGQIIQHVAESAKMSRKVIESLDEKEVTRRDSFLAALFRDRHLWPDEYLQHLTKVIGTIGRYGNAIIVGRGANHILPQTKTFRVRIIAPLDYRINYVMEDRKYTRTEAEQYVVKIENNRKAFIRKYFNADVTDPKLYDIVVNTGGITIEGAMEAIKIAFKLRRQ